MEIKWIPIEKRIPLWTESRDDLDYPTISEIKNEYAIEGIESPLPVGLMLLTDEPQGNDVLGKVIIIGSTNRNGGLCDCCADYYIKYRAYSLSLVEELKKIGFKE